MQVMIVYENGVKSKKIQVCDSNLIFTEVKLGHRLVEKLF